MINPVINELNVSAKVTLIKCLKHIEKHMIQATFITMDFKSQLGYFIEFLTANNIHLLVTHDCRIIYSIVTKGNLKYVEEVDDKVGIIENYEHAVITAFKYLEKPF
jgi:hypothetical protein